MGITNSPDFFQSIIHSLFADINDVENFINGIGLCSFGSFDEDPIQFHQVLLWLERSGFIVNPLKWEWAVTSTEYLGFLLTPEGIKSFPHKVTAISKLTFLSSTKYICSFKGLANYNKDMWPQLALKKKKKKKNLLTDVYSIKKKLVWTNTQEYAFQQIKH